MVPVPQSPPLGIGKQAGAGPPQHGSTQTSPASQVSSAVHSTGSPTPVLSEAVVPSVVEADDVAEVVDASEVPEETLDVPEDAAAVESPSPDDPCTTVSPSLSSS